jgi:hypothetical protein
MFRETFSLVLKHLIVLGIPNLIPLILIVVKWYFIFTSNINYLLPSIKTSKNFQLYFKCGTTLGLLLTVK